MIPTTYVIKSIIILNAVMWNAGTTYHTPCLWNMSYNIFHEQSKLFT